MKHTKKHYLQTRETSDETIIIEGPLTAAELKEYKFHHDLTAFRPATKQFEAIMQIASFPEGRIIVARTKDTIIGYVTYLHPDPLERWSKFAMDDLIELGAIEVIPDFRGAKIASGLLEVSMMDTYMENYIIISTEYYWHWDLDGTKLSIWDYRKVMEKMMAAGGLLPAPTDDPEIISHPANCLMVRIGKNVSEESIKKFDTLRFLQRHHYRNMREGL
ncbi:MAG: GNAT family N-acetyltransferase [Bacillota bacterium]|uniref:GNAT family N-acetyltransferase n=1 Tax=Virgibacillus salarius TaxID=447199 RepID=A0A941E3V9_9BACI|nr:MULTISPECIES: GNAT family N-acetyltransferase [Bacillaceae]NAZ11047.1 GNAT family N-acetyltransferase [Agaribacter marinus]MBR7798338.1 GNAT family N-acetyltransferase [Virgibacillus salarius]MCC2252755.1 GNAT family N-acetyltransferase [Virgibacillus sp. AGTR]MDY7046595.1 GNAT family N-acetyltransferase [Virgibacillus sp. M23]QRZ17726.1 GNAT family N-acetyltransferase [Virgibacillus sp. AGTR]